MRPAPVLFANDAALQEALHLWQKRLRLQDLDIYADLVGAADMENGNEGECKASARFPSAHIRLLRAEDWRLRSNETSCAPVRDMEVDLVHELLHVAMRDFDPRDQDSLAYDRYECFVECMARCLVALVR